MVLLPRRHVLRYGAPAILAPCLLWPHGAAQAQTAVAAQRKRGPVRLETAVAGATIRALVVGIDTYKVPAVAPTLSGAVADARDLTDVLTRAGVGDVTLLVDAEATRPTMQTALRGLAERTRRNDLVVVAFAGHGSQEPERKAGSKASGREEYFVLWGFSPDPEGSTERILDDEMYIWVKGIADKGAEVIYAADCCFGGGMSKSVDPRVNRMPVRALERVERPEQAGPGAYYIKPGEDRLDVGTVPAHEDATETIATLTFLAGVDENTKVPEVLIDTEPTARGALSFALARALEGQADHNGDGLTTRKELFAYMRSHVRVLSSNWQTPVVAPRRPGSGDTALFRNAPRIQAASVPAISRPASTSAPQIQSPAAGALIRDPRTGDIIDGSGCIVAYGQPPGALAVARARIAAYQDLARLAQGRMLDAALSPAGRDYRLGDPFTLTVGGVYGRFLILLNLAGDGRVQFLFPKGRVDPYWGNEELVQTMRADDPPGADTLVIIAATERRTRLEGELAGLDDKHEPAALVDAIATHLGPNDQIGIATYTTLRR